MKKLNVFHFLITILVVLASCMDTKKTNEDSSEEVISGENFRDVTITDEYRISIPKVMVSTTGLNNEARLQFQNVDQEIYLIILEEPKTELEHLLTNQNREAEESSILSEYGALQLERLGGAMKVKKRVGPKKLTIQELNAELFEIMGEIPNLKADLYYSLTFIEGVEKVYTVMSWTLDSQKDKYRTTFEHIATSFKPIN